MTHAGSRPLAAPVTCAAAVGVAPTGSGSVGRPAAREPLATADSLPMNLKIATLVINNLRILRFQGFKARTWVGRSLSPGERARVRGPTRPSRFLVPGRTSLGNSRLLRVHARLARMRIGMLATAATHDLDHVTRLGLRSLEWVRFAESPAGPQHPDWKPFADWLAAECTRRGLRLSAVGALYENPLDPPQTERARTVFRRAIEVAAHLGVRTVAGFAGGVIRFQPNPRGGNQVQEAFESHLPALLAFWEPLARFAADHGVRIAFEHCPQGAWHLPVMGYNALGRPAMWERFFNETTCDNLGLEWDPSHLICQFIDPVANLRKFGARVFHVHAKDAFINPELLAAYGPCHPGVAEHRFPGLGQADWAQIIHTLVRVGYDSDLNIEGWHDPVYHDHRPEPGTPLAGRQLEDAGLLIAKRTLETYLPPEDSHP